ncbi:MAG: patatin family protein [Lachnospiraceae bacterium]|nr:patatin family protein [Lachnospiraceae bacterium]
MKNHNDKTVIQAGLVLEGGGMRGLYTAGILDFFMEKGLQFASCYGVSAGACHLSSYMSDQQGRAYRISIDYLKDPDYCGTRTFLKTGDFFGVDYCYNRIPNELNPYDYDAAANYPGNCYAVATNIETGRAEYLPLKDLRDDITAIQASASLPLLSRNVEFHEKLYLDGGMADSIPIRRSQKDGNAKNVIVLTRPADYRKKPLSVANLQAMRIKYKKYPMVIRTMQRRHLVYNRTLAYIQKLEAEGCAFVFRPEKLVKIDRIEKDTNKLKVLYLQGYHDAAINYEAMMLYLQQ